MESVDKFKMVFVMRWGFFEFNVMFFGLSCVLVIFECFMESVLVGL